jgi:glycine cleavage system regulatory protein
MSTSIVLSIISDDHPGIVELLSELLTQHGGNWTESSMLSLAGKFAGIVLVSLPDEESDAFINGLRALEDSGMQILAQNTRDVLPLEGAREFTLDLVGQDHPGIVHEITDVLADHNINVQELETHCQSASMSGETLFLAHARLLVPRETSLRKLQESLEDLANELMVEIKLDE